MYTSQELAEATTETGFCSDWLKSFGLSESDWGQNGDGTTESYPQHEPPTAVGFAADVGGVVEVAHGKAP